MSRKFTIKNNKNFKKIGYFTKKNYLNSNDEKKLFKSFEKMKFEQISQKKKSHYSHVFKSSYNGMPSADEPYLAKYGLGKNPEKNKTFVDFWKKYLIPDLKKLTKNKAKYFLLPNIFKLKKGDFLRCHIDNYVGICGYTFYLNKGWKWDYGGILNLVLKDGASDQIFPFNNSIMFRNEKKQLYHFLNEVPFYAKNHYQYLVVGFGADKKHDKHKRDKEIIFKYERDYI